MHGSRFRSLQHLVVGVPRRHLHLGGQVVLEVALHGLAAARLHGRDLNGLQVIIERDGISNVNHDHVRVLRELDREALALIVVELGLAELRRDADGLPDSF